MDDAINSAIKQHFLSNNLFNDTQFGFHQGHSASNLISVFVRSGDVRSVYTMFSTIRDTSDTKAVHVQMQQGLNNIQAWADKCQ
eukprot:g32633.t1